jgi:hypothetical protein
VITAIAAAAPEGLVGAAEAASSERFLEAAAAQFGEAGFPSDFLLELSRRSGV